MGNLVRNNANHYTQLLIALCPEVLDSGEVVFNNRVSALISIIDSRRLDEGLLIQLENSHFSFRELTIKSNVKSWKRRPETWVLESPWTDCWESQKLRKFAKTVDTFCRAHQAVRNTLMGTR